MRERQLNNPQASFGIKQNNQHDHTMPTQKKLQFGRQIRSSYIQKQQQIGHSSSCCNLQNQNQQYTSRYDYIPYQRKITEYVDKDVTYYQPKKRRQTQIIQQKSMQMIPKQVTEVHYMPVETRITRYPPKQRHDKCAHKHRLRPYDDYPIERRCLNYPYCQHRHPDSFYDYDLIDRYCDRCRLQCSQRYGCNTCSCMDCQCTCKCCRRGKINIKPVYTKPIYLPICSRINSFNSLSRLRTNHINTSQQRRIINTPSLSRQKIIIHPPVQQQAIVINQPLLTRQVSRQKITTSNRRFQPAPAQQSINNNPSQSPYTIINSTVRQQVKEKNQPLVKQFLRWNKINNIQSQRTNNTISRCVTDLIGCNRYPQSRYITQQHIPPTTQQYVKIFNLDQPVSNNSYYQPTYDDTRKRSRRDNNYTNQY